MKTAAGPRPLADLVRTAITRFEHTVERIEQTSSSPKEQRLAAELLSYIATCSAGAAQGEAGAAASQGLRS